MNPSSDQIVGLVALLQALRDRDYSFVTPTPSTCRRMHERGPAGRPTLRDIFGWSLAFNAADIDKPLLDLLAAADALEMDETGWRSRLRVSTIHRTLFLHSAFPATAADAVFLGPDSYRFADFLALELRASLPVRTIVDVGTGAGVGGLVAALATRAPGLTLTDINPRALRLAAANAVHAGVKAELRQASGLDGAPQAVDLVVANPPYVAGISGRAYKDGGDLHGARLSLNWAIAAIGRLTPGGRMLLYTGSPILRGGVDRFRIELAAAAAVAGCALNYRELDPDIFGGELRRSSYDDVERIVAVGAVITAPA